MARSAYSIGRHTCQLQVGVKITKSAHESAERSRLAACIHYQYHWQFQVFSHGCAASFSR